MTSCLGRAGRRKHTQVTNELHQTPRVSLSSISSQPNPGRGGGVTACQGRGLWTPPPHCVHLSHGSQLCLLSCSTETLRRTRGGGRKQCPPLGPACVAGRLWPGLWAVDSDSGGHAGRHMADKFPLCPGSWPQTSSYWPAAPAPKHLPRLPCPLGPACDKGPPQQAWACLPSGRATEGLGQVTGSQRGL